MSQILSPFEENKSWSKQFNLQVIKHLESIFINHNFIEGTLEEDRNECCDFKTPDKSIIISARVRDYDTCYPIYVNDILLNIKRDIDGKNELEKIIQGHSDYYFYGFAPKAGPYILFWKIYNLSIFRLWLHKLILEKGHLPDKLKNYECIPFNIKEIEQDIVMAYGGRNANSKI
jgi:hypothetical protein